MIALPGVALVPAFPLLAAVVQSVQALEHTSRLGRRVQLARFGMQGPTVVLKVLEYSLIRDVQASLRHPRRPDSAFLHPPLVVLQGFGAEQHMKLTAVLFQNMFPSINVSKAKLSECQV